MRFYGCALAVCLMTTTVALAQPRVGTGEIFTSVSSPNGGPPTWVRTEIPAARFGYNLLAHKPAAPPAPPQSTLKIEPALHRDLEKGRATEVVDVIVTFVDEVQIKPFPHLNP